MEKINVKILKSESYNNVELSKEIYYNNLDELDSEVIQLEFQADHMLFRANKGNVFSTVFNILQNLIRNQDDNDFANDLFKAIMNAGSIYKFIELALSQSNNNEIDLHTIFYEVYGNDVRDKFKYNWMRKAKDNLPF